MRWRRAHRPPVGITVAVVVALVCQAAPRADTVVPAHAHLDVVALVDATAEPTWVPWIHEESGRPYRLLDPHMRVAVEPSVTEHVGREPVVAGLTAFNQVPGSAVDVTITPDPDTAEVEVVAVPCEEMAGTQGRARPHVAAAVADAALVDTARIEVCPALGERSGHYARHLVAHELAHVLGFGHLCDQPDCWPLDRPPDPCAFMRPSVHPCQDLEPVRAALPTLYPA